MSEAASETYVLPSALIGRADLARLVREVETVDGDLESQKVRTGGDKTAYHMPTMSQALSDFLDLNKIDVTNVHTRMLMKEQLRKLKDKAPIVHMTFAVEADPESIQKLVAWLRENAHPHTLLSIGLQPALVGGVYMRTPNHIHDFSMRSVFQGKRGVMISQLEGLK